MKQLSLWLFVLLLCVSCEKTEFAKHNDTAEKEKTISSSTEDIPSEVISVTEIPQACTIWREHVVALSEPLSEKESLITLLSLYDWASVTSAYNTKDSTMAAKLAQGYQEYELGSWSIPTETQAKVLRSTYPKNDAATTNLSALNNLLSGIGASEIHITEGNSNARYLCENATKTFSFASGTTISKAGTKVSNYRLRLVRVLRVKLK